MRRLLSFAGVVGRRGAGGAAGRLAVCPNRKPGSEGKNRKAVTKELRKFDDSARAVPRHASPPAFAQVIASQWNATDNRTSGLVYRHKPLGRTVPCLVRTYRHKRCNTSRLTRADSMTHTS